MTDRILSHCLWLIVMCLIGGAAMGGLMLIYSGFFNLITRQFESGGALTGAGLILSTGCWVLCKHSDDLIDRRL
jgi:hypothetical protein